MPIPENADPVDAVRFTRFYTSRLGVLQEGLLDSGFSSRRPASCTNSPIATARPRRSSLAIWNWIPAI